MTSMAVASTDCFWAREKLRGFAARALARLRTQIAIDATFVVFAASLCLLVIAIFLDRLLSLSRVGINIWIIWGGISALGIPYILWRTYTPRLHQALAAVLADDRMGLNARLCTALSLDLEDPAVAPFSEPFFAEALEKLQRLDVERAFPIRVPRFWALLLIPAFTAFGLHHFMEYQDQLGLEARREQRRKAEEVRQKAASALEGKLEDMKKKIEDRPDQAGGNFKVNQLMKQADQIVKDLKEGNRDANEALLALGQLKREIEQEKDKIAEGKEFMDRMKKLQDKNLNLDDGDLTKAVSEALKMGDPGAAARQLRKMANELRKDILDNPNKTDAQKQAELEKLKKEVEKLAGALAEDEALRQNLRELSEKVMGAAEFEKLREELKKQAEKEGKGADKKMDEIGKQIEKVAEELERLEEDDDVALNENEKNEMDQLDNMEDGVDDAMDGLAQNEPGGG
ncbi:MAG TPA: hypothetical protein VGP72_16825 [Planctomycetota bacterium]|jgi:hypothetical protein